MAINVIQGDLRIAGAIIPNTISLPNGIIQDEHIQGAANIDATKLEQQRHYVYAQGGIFDAPIDETKLTFIVTGSQAEIISVHAFMYGAPSVDAIVTIKMFDKLGNAILLSPIEFTSADADKTLKAGSLNAPYKDLVQDDWISIEVYESAGVGLPGTGIMVQIATRETAF